MKSLFALLLVITCVGQGWAGEAQPLARNEAVEQRMLALTRNLRCLVCQDESLAASQADLARDLRNEIRTMMEKGRSNQQIEDYLVQRYGNYVRYRPPFDAETAVLWVGPFVLLVMGLGFLLMYVRRRSTQQDVPLDVAQIERARQLLADAGVKELQ